LSFVDLGPTPAVALRQGLLKAGTVKDKGY